MSKLDVRGQGSLAIATVSPVQSAAADPKFQPPPQRPRGRARALREVQPSFGFDSEPTVSALARAESYPQLRFMGSKHRLLPWLNEVLGSLRFTTALDAFSGSGCVSYLLKSMGKTVTSNDFLLFAKHFANGLTANPGIRLDANDMVRLQQHNPRSRHFIANTFRGIFFPDADNKFLDTVSANLREIENPFKQSLAIAALCRSALKKQARGVFTISGLDGRHDDGRRDLSLSMQEHFAESVAIFNKVTFDDGKCHRAMNGDVFSAPVDADLVYMDPPYVPRSDDNCYIKRYHFLEGLSAYWKDLPIIEDSKVKKIAKRFTPFSYRRTAVAAFDAMFSRFRSSTLVLSYSSNGYPDCDVLVAMMRRYKSTVTVHECEHRYHFGTHAGVREDRAVVREYLIVGV